MMLYYAGHLMVGCDNFNSGGSMKIKMGKKPVKAAKEKVKAYKRSGKRIKLGLTKVAP